MQAIVRPNIFLFSKQKGLTLQQAANGVYAAASSNVLSTGGYVNTNGASANVDRQCEKTQRYIFFILRKRRRMFTC